METKGESHVPQKIIRKLPKSDTNRARLLPELSGHSSTIYFLKFYLDWAYYLCLSPFKLKVNSLGQFYPHTWLPQTLLSAAFSVLGYFWIIRDIRLSIPTEPTNPSLYFLMILIFMFFCILTLTTKQLWMNQSEITNIVNFIAETKLSSSTENHGLMKFAALIACFVYTGNGLAATVAGEHSGPSCNVTTSGSDPQRWWQAIVTSGRYNFFMEHHHQYSSSWQLDSSQEQVLTIQDGLIGVLAAIGFLNRRLFVAYCDLLLLMATLSLSVTARAFASTLTENGSGSTTATRKLSWPEVRQNYNLLKEMANKINNLLGTNVTLFLVKSILYYAIGFKKVHSWTSLCFVMTYFAGASFGLIITADICHQVRNKALL